jgi:hypothetical protein
VSSIFTFLIKQYWSFILICVLGTGFGIYFGGLWSFLPFIFLLLFFYEWNIAPRKERTWFFFDSLPLSFMKRYLLRVITPFLFSFIIIFLLTYFKKGYGYDLLSSVSDGLRISSLFVLSSILAQSMTGFLAWVILAYVSCYLFSSFSFYEIATAIFCLALSYYHLSGKRASKLKSVIIPVVSCALILAFGSYFKIKIYEASLFIPIHNVQLSVAENLLENRAFIGKNLVVDWILGGNNDPNSSPIKILIPSKYDDKLLSKMESIFLQDEICSDSCHQLADLVSNFPKNWNQERLQLYLNSNREVEQIYALEVLDGAIQPLFFNRVIQLSRSDNQEVSALAISLIRKWGDINSFQLPMNSIF